MVFRADYTRVRSDSSKCRRHSTGRRDGAAGGQHVADVLI